MTDFEWFFNLMDKQGRKGRVVRRRMDYETAMRSMGVEPDPDADYAGQGYWRAKIPEDWERELKKGGYLRAENHQWVAEGTETP